MIGLVVALALAQAPPDAPDPTLFDPATGYRIAHYRGVIHVAPPGVPRIDGDETVALHENGRALFIDVTPADSGIRDPRTGAWRLAAPHQTIAGAHWFPEAGRGPSDPPIDTWFAKGVRRLAHGHRDGRIVVFCLADCWMSWNASLKLKRAGYRNVLWYADGADGWRDRSLSLADVSPEK